MDYSKEILSDLIVYSKYARYLPEKKRRETWEEICDRVELMHRKKFPDLKKEINQAMRLVREKKIVPSMRSMQFAGKAMEINHARGYNCSFVAITKPFHFAEIAFLLLSGSGCGYSVQERHVSKLPPVTRPGKSKRFLIGDSIEGWADAFRALLNAYLQGKGLPLFDYRDIRPAGSPLKTGGGRAPGPEPIRRALNKITSLLDGVPEGKQLYPIQVHDIICHIADAIVSGGVRRSALIVLFDQEDEEMLNAKGNFIVETYNGGFHLNPTTQAYEGQVVYKGKVHFVSLWGEEQFLEFQNTKRLPWYYFEPQRARSNNSVVLHRKNFRRSTAKSIFMELWEKIKESGCGEPGFMWTNDYDLGTNPCVSGDSKVTVLMDIADWETMGRLKIPFMPVYRMGDDKTVYRISVLQLFDNWYEIQKHNPKILSYSFKENEVKFSDILSVVQTKKNAEVMTLELKRTQPFSKNTELNTTPDHRISVVRETEDWLEMKDVRVGDKVRVFDEHGFRSSLVDVTSPPILNIYTENVYDITVADTHSFFANDILVHNCGEISLKGSGQHCNLTEVNLSNIESQEDFLERIKAATFLGTIQAAYTDFHYLNPKWEENDKEEALLGVSFTGIADFDYQNLPWKSAAELAVATNKKFAEILGISPAARIGTVKPSGTTSTLLGTSSGIHGRHSKFYIRRIRYAKQESIARYLLANHPELIEEEFGNSTNIVVSIPQSSPTSSIFRNESPINTLERVKFFHQNWILPTHSSGKNTHNVSCTISVRPDEWEEVGNWCWLNRDIYMAISVLPYDGGTYIQAPFEEISEEKYRELYSSLKKVDFEKIIEEEDTTQLQGEAACAGGSCEII